MNVFACDASPRLAAQYLADRHVVKMCLETTQIACTTLRARCANLDAPLPDGLYRSTHLNHPATQATLNDGGFRAWVMTHGCWLFAEYRHRYNKQHKSLQVFSRAFAEHCLLDEKELGVNLADIRHFPAPSLTRSALCMPDSCKVEGCSDPAERVVLSYRKYLGVKYAEWADRGRHAKWTRRERPVWLE